MSSREIAAALPSTAVESLRAATLGSVYAPGDAGYDNACLAWNRAYQHHPAVIVRPQTATDVVAAVRFAAEHDLTIAVQSTGHGVTRPADDAMLILTGDLTELRIDPAAQTAYLGAGLQWGPVLAATQAHGLAPLLGSSPTVGVVGYTLGGGLGWLGRKYGLAVDSVLAFDIVTPDGQLVRASASEHPDLFWALRGGGGNFGVVVGMEMRLYPVTEVYAGNLYYPAEQAREVLLRYREWIKDAPDELTTSVVLFNFPNFPQVPEPVRGKSFAIVRGCYAGPTEEGERLLAYWRQWRPPVMDAFGPMPFAQAETISNDPHDPSPGVSNGGWLTGITDEVIDTLVARVPATGGPSPLIYAEIRHAGGAVKRADASKAAYGNRDAEHLLMMIGIVMTPDMRARLEAFTNDLLREIQGSLTGGVYINFHDGEAGRTRTRDAFTPETYARLAAVKAQVDPTNRFDHSYAIAPATD